MALFLLFANPSVLIVRPLLLTVICFALPFLFEIATLETLTLNFCSTAYFTSILFIPEGISKAYLFCVSCKLVMFSVTIGLIKILEKCFIICFLQIFLKDHPALMNQ